MSRLTDMLNVKESVPFRFRDFEVILKNGSVFVSKDGNYYEPTAGFIVEMIEHPEEIIAKIKLTDRQITAVKGRVAEGYEWMAKDKVTSCRYFYKKRPIKGERIFTSDCGIDGYSHGNPCFYEFCTWENSPINLKGILRENGVEV